VSWEVHEKFYWYKTQKSDDVFIMALFKGKGKKGGRDWGNENFVTSRNIFHELHPKWKEILINLDWNTAP
jgi:hypothetical protein